MASFKTSSLALVGAFAASALAHGTVPEFATDGERHGGFLLNYFYEKQNGGTPPSIAAWSAENLDNGFVDGTSYQSSDINCHKNAAPGAETVTVAAGGTVDFFWSEWPESHFGPVFTYVARCDGDCAAADKDALKWVKIDEAGINTETQVWAATDLINNNNTWTTTVPADLAAGNYVFRHEIIAMHGAGETNGAQNYPQCFNIAVTGSGTAQPEGVLGTELYTADHPGIKFNPYTTITSYDIPGPALFGSGGNVTTTPVPAHAPVPSPAPPANPGNGTETAPTPAPVEEEPEECPAAARRRARRARHARRHARDLKQ